MSEIEIEGLTAVRGIEKIQEGFLFKGLSFEDTQLLASICTFVDKGDGEVIIEEQSLGQDLYLIIKGEVLVFRSEGDTNMPLAVLKSGDMFGEMSLIDDLLTSAAVAAQGPAHLLKISKKDLEHLMKDNSRFAAKIYRSFCISLSQRLRRANEKLEGMSSHG